VLENMDLKTGIFRILSDDMGPSQSELRKRLIAYSERIEKLDLVLNVDKGDLSRKLKSVEKDKIIFYKRKKMIDRDQWTNSYYITKDLAAFEHIIKHLAKNIDTALDVSPLNTKDWKKFHEIRDVQPRELTMGTKCALIDALIKSSYVRQLIGACGFKSVYQIYKKEVNDYCDLKVFIELAQSLVHEGSINDLDDFGPEFISDAESRKKAIEAIDFALSKNQSNP
jgi:hypothetical protein